MRSVLLDTSFFIRLLKEDDPLSKNAESYFKYFLQNQTSMKCSTISIAEYCVRDSYDNLPLKNIQILPFNLDHAVKAGELARFVFDHKDLLNLENRAIIPNDTKLFAQAEVDPEIDGFLTSDTKSKKIYDLIKSQFHLKFQLIDLSTPCSEQFGFLNL